MGRLALRHERGGGGRNSGSTRRRPVGSLRGRRTLRVRLGGRRGAAAALSLLPRAGRSRRPVRALLVEPRIHLVFLMRPPPPTATVLPCTPLFRAGRRRVRVR